MSVWCGALSDMSDKSDKSDKIGAPINKILDFFLSAGYITQEICKS